MSDVNICRMISNLCMTKKKPEQKKFVKGLTLFARRCIFSSTLRCSKAQKLHQLRPECKIRKTSCSISASLCSMCHVKVVCKCCVWLKTLHWVLLFWQDTNKRWRSETRCLSISLEVWLRAKQEREKWRLQSKQEVVETVKKIECTGLWHLTDKCEKYKEPDGKWTTGIPENCGEEIKTASS